MAAAAVVAVVATMALLAIVIVGAATARAGHRDLPPATASAPPASPEIVLSECAHFDLWEIELSTD